MQAVTAKVQVKSKLKVNAVLAVIIFSQLSMLSAHGARDDGAGLADARKGLSLVDHAKTNQNKGADGFRNRLGTGRFFSN